MRARAKTALQVHRKMGCSDCIGGQKDVTCVQISDIRQTTKLFEVEKRNMSKQSELVRKRKEAQKTILALKDKTASVVILDLFGKAFKGQGVFQRLGYWLSNIIIMNLIMLGPWALIGRALNEFEETSVLWISGVIIVELVVVGIAVGYTVIQDLFHNIAFVVVEKVNDDRDLSRLVNWLRSTWSIRNVSAFVLIIAAMWFYFGAVRPGVQDGGFPGFGYLISVAFISLFAGVGFYVTFWVGLLSYNLGNYQYEIDSFLLADSEIVRNISETLARKVYILATYFAVFTLVGSSHLMSEDLRNAASIPFLLIVWAVITAQFILTRNTLGKVINKAKLKTLDNIRSQINSLEAKGEILEKETAEKILCLMDIYDRVKTAKADTFDFRSFSTFVGQLMLPLLGLLLGNLDQLSIFLP